MKKFNYLLSMMIAFVMTSSAQTTLLSTSSCLPAVAGTTLPISLTQAPPANSAGVLTVYYQGDFNAFNETADIFDENAVLIGTTPFIIQCNINGQDSVIYNIPLSDMSAWAADGVIDFDFTPTANVNPAECNPCGEIQFKLEYTPITGDNDASVASVDSPYVFCAGASNVLVTLQNAGTNQLDSMLVNWELNGIAQPTIAYVGLLDTVNGSFPNSAPVSLGSGNFTAGANAIKVWSSMPNGVADSNNNNDTIRVSVISAAAPTSVVLSNVTLSTIDVNAVGGAGTIEYEIGPSGFALGTGTTRSSLTANFTISALSQGTAYDVYVRSNCGAGDASAYVGPQTFNTSFGVPFLQDFESWSAGGLTNPLPQGWSSPVVSGPRWEAEDATGANENSFATGPFFDNTTPTTAGGMYLYLETSSGAGIDTLLSPPIYIDTNLSTIELGFSYHMFGAAMGTLEVFADTNGVRNLITSFTGAQQVAQADGFIRYSSLLTGYEGQSVQLIFVGVRGTSYTSDMAIDDITITPVLPLNVGVVEVQSPSGNLCPGPVNVNVGVKNFGSLVLDSVNVLWNVNGVVDSVMYVGSIFPGDTASVSLGVLTVSSTVVYDLDFYTNRPNNAADQFPADDTLKIQGLRTGLSGVLTLDAALPASSSNLISFSELGQVLSSYGICGPTTVNVAAGTYVDVLAMDNVLGLSSINTLTIDGGDSATTTIENDLANDDAVISLKSSSYVTVKNLTVRSTKTAGFNVHFGVHLADGSNFDSLVNVRVLVNPAATFNTYGVGATVSASTNFGNGDHANNFVMMNSSVDGGDYGVNFRGNGANNPGPSSTNGWNMNNQFIGNTLTNGNNYGFYLDDQDGAVLSGNTVSDLRTTSTFNGYGIYYRDAMNFHISSNNLVVPYTGIYVYDANSSSNGTRIGSSEISNNMVSSNINSAIWLVRPVNVNVWNNSIYCGSTAANDAALYFDDGFGTPAIDSLDVRNNAISSLGLALKIDEPDSVFRKLDNNSYFSSGGNLLDIDGVIYTDLATYQAAQTAYNFSSLNGDPQFTSSTDLHVVGAFINDGGDNSVPLIIDIDGDARPMAGATAMDIGADEFDPPTCPQPSGAGSTNATLNSIDIFWTGAINDYQYEVVLAGAAQGSATIASTTLDSVTVSGLATSTSYEFYVREICGRGDTSLWIGPISAGTNAAFPYFEDFEIGDGGWRVIGSGSSWAWGTPAGTDITSAAGGTGAWVTNLTGDYNNNEIAFIEGPSLDLSGLIVDPVLTFSLTYDTESCCDEGWVDYSLDGGSTWTRLNDNGGAFQWYNDLGNQWWDGTSSGGLGVWVNAENILTGLAGESSVKIRFGFASDGSVTNEGFGIDNVRIDLPPSIDAGVLALVSPVTGCGLVGSDSVKVQIKNFGGDTLRSTPVSFEFNGSAAVTETVTTAILPGDTLEYTFTTSLVTFVGPGNYTVKAYTGVVADAIALNDTLNEVVVNIPLVSSFPYFEDFEAGNGGWTASGVASTWAWGTPAGTVIASAAGGTGALVTNLTGDYNNGESSYIESPCLDLSSLAVDPVLSFSLTYDTESCCDEGWIDVSINGGVTWSRLSDNGGAAEWYNDLFNQWWDATSSGGAGVWVNAENILTGLAGESSVKIRFGFSSDGSVTREGFGIDNISIDLPSANNMALVDIVTPVSGAYLAGTSDSIRIRIANVGADTATNMTVNYALNGGSVQTETIAVVAPGDTLVHTFNSLISLPAAGQADTLDVYVAFALDTDNSNDSILGYIFDNDIKGIPYVEDFENAYVTGLINANQQGGWNATSGQNPVWEIEDATGANENSGGTGPFYDRTTFGSSGGFYAYLETSGLGSLGDQDTMRSPSIIIPANSQPLALGYSYHMFGGTMGVLEVFIESAGTFTRLDSVGGQIQLAGDSAWSDTSIALTGAFNGQIVNIVFVGTRGSSYTGDMSIDDISLDLSLLVGVKTIASELGGISIYPNPSNGLFTLNIETLERENFNVTVRDARGRNVYTESLNVNGRYKDNLDFTSFTKGMYYMIIQSETGSRVEKLIIQ